MREELMSGIFSSIVTRVTCQPSSSPQKNKEKINAALENNPEELWSSWREHPKDTSNFFTNEQKSKILCHALRNDSFKNLKKIFKHLEKGDFAHHLFLQNNDIEVIEENENDNSKISQQNKQSLIDQLKILFENITVEEAKNFIRHYPKTLRALFEYEDFENFIKETPSLSLAILQNSFYVIEATKKNEEWPNDKFKTIYNCHKNDFEIVDSYRHYLGKKDNEQRTGSFAWIKRKIGISSISIWSREDQFPSEELKIEYELFFTSLVYELEEGNNLSVYLKLIKEKQKIENDISYLNAHHEQNNKNVKKALEDLNERLDQKKAELNPFEKKLNTLSRNLEYLKQKPSLCKELSADQMALIIAIARKEKQGEYDFLLTYLRLFQKYNPNELKILFQNMMKKEHFSDSQISHGYKILKLRFFNSNEWVKFFPFSQQKYARNANKDIADYLLKNPLLLQSLFPEPETDDQKYENFHNAKGLLGLVEGEAKTAFSNALMKKLKNLPAKMGIIFGMFKTMHPRKFKKWWKEAKKEKNECLQEAKSRLSSSVSGETDIDSSTLEFLNKVLFASDYLRGQVDLINNDKYIQIIFSELDKENPFLTASAWAGIVSDDVLFNKLKDNCSENWNNICNKNPYFFAKENNIPLIDFILDRSEKETYSQCKDEFLNHFSRNLFEKIKGDCELQEKILKSCETWDSFPQYLRDLDSLLVAIVQSGYLSKFFSSDKEIPVDQQISILSRILNLDELTEDQKRNAIVFFKLNHQIQTSDDLNKYYKLSGDNPEFKELFFQKHPITISHIVTADGGMLDLNLRKGNVVSIEAYVNNIRQAISGQKTSSQDRKKLASSQHEQELALALLSAAIAIVADPTNGSDYYKPLSHFLNTHIGDEKIIDKVKAFVEKMVITAKNSNSPLNFSHRDFLMAIMSNEQLISAIIYREKEPNKDKAKKENIAKIFAVFTKYKTFFSCPFPNLLVNNHIHYYDGHAGSTQSIITPMCSINLHAFLNQYLSSDTHGNLFVQHGIDDEKFKIEFIANLILNHDLYGQEKFNCSSFSKIRQHFVINFMSEHSEIDLNYWILADDKLREKLVEKYNMDSSFDIIFEHCPNLFLFLPNHKLNAQQIKQIKKKYEDWEGFFSEDRQRAPIGSSTTFKPNENQLLEELEEEKEKKEKNIKNS